MYNYWNNSLYLVEYVQLLKQLYYLVEYVQLLKQLYI